MHGQLGGILLTGKTRDLMVEWIGVRDVVVALAQSLEFLKGGEKEGFGILEDKQMVIGELLSSEVRAWRAMSREPGGGS